MFASKLQVNTKICAVLLVLSFLVPFNAQAQSATQFQPQTREQIIAYLYGQITQLQILLAKQIAVERNGTSNSHTANNSTSRSVVKVMSLSAQNITDQSVTLRGEVDLNGESEVYVWFEYVDENDIERKSTAKRITDDRGDKQMFTTSLNNLKDDERYYFRAAAEDENGNRSYGERGSFTTENGSNYNDNTNDEFELVVVNRTIKVGGNVQVQWQLPNGDVNSKNWIGIYEIGGRDKDFMVWKYVTTDDGTVSLQVNKSGTFEARLFLKNSYNLEVTSQNFTVSP